MQQRDYVSYQAFIEQIENWQMNLNREAKKLKCLKEQCNDEFKINQIQIVLTQIESQSLKYRKQRDKVQDSFSQKKIDSMVLVQEYNLLSKRFMELLQKIGNCLDYPEENIEQSFLNEQDNNANFTEQVVSKARGFMKETFTHKNSKQPIKQSKIKSKRPSLYHGTSKISKKESSSRSGIVTRQRQNISLNISTNQQLKQSIKLKESSWLNDKNKNKDQCDLWDIRYQLKEIKSMMTQIQNQIKYHNHENLQMQMSKIQHHNKKMLLQLKSLKDDNKFSTAKIQTLKQQIQAEKQAQLSMVKQFEKPRHQSKQKTFYDHQKSQTVTQQVSDWVRMRI